ncbi:hypothetical protein N8609_02290 [Verrucomicrobia bacterium]|nr:hypothetical protein [Verrucomicrobiota bacterium]
MKSGMRTGGENIDYRSMTIRARIVSSKACPFNFRGTNNGDFGGGATRSASQTNPKSGDYSDESSAYRVQFLLAHELDSERTLRNLLILHVFCNHLAAWLMMCQ